MNGSFFSAYLDRADSDGNNDTSIVLKSHYFQRYTYLNVENQFEKIGFKVFTHLFVKISLLADTFCSRFISLNT